jgi:DNA-directed RNA polymerase beta subunit
MKHETLAADNGAFGIPESFKVLLHELRSIGLDMSTYKIEKNPVQKV